MTVAASLPELELEPLRLPWDLRLSQEQFEQVCQANPDAVLELSPDGFRLPDGSVLSPDALLVRLERWQALSPQQRRSFPPLCPDLVVALASPSDEGPRGVTALRQKMEIYRRNGARIGWLLLPAERAVEIWHADAPAPQRISPAETLSAEPLLAGLHLDLAEIWQD